MRAAIDTPFSGLRRLRRSNFRTTSATSAKTKCMQSACFECDFRSAVCIHTRSPFQLGLWSFGRFLARSLGCGGAGRAGVRSAGNALLIGFNYYEGCFGRLEAPLCRYLETTCMVELAEVVRRFNFRNFRYPQGADCVWWLESQCWRGFAGCGSVKWSIFDQFLTSANRLPQDFRNFRMTTAGCGFAGDSLRRLCGGWLRQSPPIPPWTSAGVVRPCGRLRCGVLGRDEGACKRES